MQITFICKRLYTHKDLMDDQFGRLFHIPVQLAAQGHTVRVFAFDYKKGRAATDREIDGVVFSSVPASSPTQLISAYGKISSALDALRPHILFASGDTWIGAVAKRLASRHRCPWIFDVYDDYRFFQSGRMPGMRWLFNKLIKEAPLVVVAGEALKFRLGSLASRTIVAVNGVDPRHFYPRSRIAAREVLNIPEHARVVGYFGTLSEERGFHILIEACKILDRRTGDLKLLVAGRRTASDSNDACFIDDRGLVPQCEVPLMISSCDVVTIPYLSTPLTEATNACKLCEYIACEIPIVATRVAEAPLVLHSVPAALVPPNDAESLALAIEKQLREPTLVSPEHTVTWHEAAAPIAEWIRGQCEADR